MCACADYVRACLGGCCDRQRHHVLQLVAKTVRAAGLVEACAREQPASARLVEQPAIQDEVRRDVGRVDGDRAEHVVPFAGDALVQCGHVCAPIARDQRARRLLAVRFAQQEVQAHGRSRRHADASLQCRARIEAGAAASGQCAAIGQRGRRVESAVAAEKLGPVACQRVDRRAARQERPPRRELAVARVARVHAAAGLVGRGDDEWRVRDAGRAERPFDIRGDGEVHLPCRRDWSARGSRS